MSMNLLALDASTEALSITLQYQGELWRFFEVCPQQHSQKILPEIDRVLQAAHCSLKDLDGLVFGRGPGSFTGVRISVAIAQGLGFSSNLKLLGVSTLQAMAQEAFAKHGVTQVIAGIDARMDEIYVCEYQLDDQGVMQPIGEEQVLRPEALTLSNTSATAVGTAWQAYPQRAAELGLAILDELTLPNAEFMLAMAELQFAQGLAVSASEAEPHYVRDTVTWKKLPGRE
ncbi:tRNA (adenosine(37)-N6)-threonylcarbamoyltransferase complex dimerization subunit type 1 TsaB [Pseudoalteromonas fenneropenaei]|uniref:tRNA threonylcarbamoyladenosine biosynthesis protein TsaB n=1 Tax=Pseudoalteromonas fenneropenaei TaxID=1737459 RepID=A0ABV7CIS4_9GAMM